MDSLQHLSERLLQSLINRQVSERLGSIGREIGDFTKGMSEQDAKSTKLMILELVKTACDEFYTKMKSRVESGKKDSSE